MAALVLFPLFLALSPLTGSAPDECSVQGIEAERSFPFNDDMDAICDVTFQSPRKRFSVRFQNGTFVLNAQGRSTTLGDFGAPSQLSFQPAGSYFYINDGRGDAVDSLWRLYNGVAAKPKDHTAYRTSIEARFKKVQHCAANADAPNTWGIGWSADGQSAYVLAQSIVRANCGREDRYFVATVRLSDGAILDFLPASRARVKFRKYLPGNLTGSKN